MKISGRYKSVELKRGYSLREVLGLLVLEITVDKFQLIGQEGIGNKKFIAVKCRECTLKVGGSGGQNNGRFALKAGARYAEVPVSRSPSPYPTCSKAIILNQLLCGY